MIIANVSESVKFAPIWGDIFMIGIIGGAGVAATNKLLELIENRLTHQGAFRDCHHPEMLIFQATSAPSRSVFLEGKGDSFIPAYIQAGMKLKKAGATKLCMNCNTAHFAIDELSAQIGIPFINLIEEVVQEVVVSKVKRVGLIASNGCLKGRVYEKYFSKLADNVEIIYPDTKLQNLVTKGICNIKNVHRFDPINSPERPAAIFRKICSELHEAGAEKIIIGCTDIRVDFTAEKTIDSLTILCDKIIKESQQ